MASAPYEDGTVKFHHQDGSWHCVQMWKGMQRHQSLSINGREPEGKFNSSTLLFSMCSDLIYGAVCDIMEQRELDLDDKMVVVLPDFSKSSISNLLTYIHDGVVQFESQQEQDEMSQLLETLGFQESATFMRHEEVMLKKPSKKKKSLKKLFVKKVKKRGRKKSTWTADSMTDEDEANVSDWAQEYGDNDDHPEASEDQASFGPSDGLPIDVKLEVPDDPEQPETLDDKTGVLAEGEGASMRPDNPVEKVKRRRRRKKVKPPPDELTECPHCHKMLKYKSLYYHTKSCTRAVKRECKSDLPKVGIS